MIGGAGGGQVVAIAEEEAVLDQIMTADTHLALWRRSRPTNIAWVDMLTWDEVDDLAFPSALDSLDGEIDGGLAEAGYPQDARGVSLRKEIASLARRFAAVVGCDRVRLRFEVVDTDSCRKFHADAVTARLLATFAGLGTQWIEPHAPERVGQMTAGDVGIFKGRLWAPEPAILHRSPPIAGSGDVRLLLAIDPADPAASASGADG